MLRARRAAAAAGLAFAWALAIGLAASPSRAQDPEPDEELHRPERLTVGVADDLLGQLSPDGKTLYFVSNRNTTNQIFAQNQADGRAHLLFDEDADVTWPRVSPDGRLLLYIAFGERAAGQLCVRRLPAGDDRRCLDAPAAALQAEWIDAGRVALVGRQAVDGDLRVFEVTVHGDLAARTLLDRNLTSPAVSPDGRWLVYVPVERTAPEVSPAFAARAAATLEAVRLGSAGSPPRPLRLELDLPGLVGQPAFARDGRSLYVVQFFSDTNHDGVIDANDHGVLVRVPLSASEDGLTPGPPEQLTDTSWNCEYPAPAEGKLIATCSQDQSLDVYGLPLEGEVPPEWSAEELAAASETAGSRAQRQLLASRRLAKEASAPARRLAMLALAMLHLDLEEYKAATFYAGRVAALHDHATAGIARPLEALVEQRRAERNRDRGRTLEGFGAGARQRLQGLELKPAASPMAVALAHVVRSEIADSIGDKSRARSELEAVALDASIPAPIVEAYYRRADALYRGLDDREALVATARSLSEEPALSPDQQLGYARAAVRAMVRGLAFEEADARLARERAAAAPESEMAFALDLARAVLAIRDDHAPRSVRDALLVLYGAQTRPGRRAALVSDAAQRTGEVGADRELEALARRQIETVARGTRERRSAERLYRRVMTNRAYRHAAQHRYDDARADFDAMVANTGSYEAAVGAIDMRLKAGEDAAVISTSYEPPGTPPALSRFAKAYVLARQLPKLEGEAHAKSAGDALALLRSSWADLKGKRIAQALFGALLHEEYLRTGDLASAEKANVHYLVALELMGSNVRFRAMILGELGLLHARVGNYRIALGYLADRDKLPYADNAEGLGARLALARAYLHVGRDEDAATAADQAVEMVRRAPTLAQRYRVLALDAAAVDNLAAGRFARALALYDEEIPELDAAAGPAAARNRFVARLSRAASAIGAGQPARALADLADVDRRLADPALAAGLRWAHASPERVALTYRLVVTGLRARAARDLGRLDEEAKAIAERRAVLDGTFAKTKRAEYERAAMLAETQLALNASERQDVAAMASWVQRALARADDLRARAHGQTDRDELDVLWTAAELSTTAGAPLVPDLTDRLARASSEIAARSDPRLKPYERRFEVYLPLAGPAARPAASPAPAP